MATEAVPVPTPTPEPALGPTEERLRGFLQRTDVPDDAKRQAVALYKQSSVPTAPGAAGGAMVGKTIGALGPSPTADQTPLAPGAGSQLLSSVLPTPETGRQIGEQAPAEIAKSGVVGAAATLAPMALPELAGPVTTARVLRGAMRGILAGGAGVAASSAYDMKAPANIQSAILQALPFAAGQIGVEVGNGLAWNAAQQRQFRDALETPAERLARSAANKTFYESEQARLATAARVQGIGEQSAAGQTQALVEPLAAMPGQLSSTPMSAPVVGSTLQDIMKGTVLPRTEQRKTALYGKAVEIGNAVAGKRNAVHLVEPAKVVLRELATQEQQLGHIPDPNGEKLKKRLNDLINSSTSDETRGVPLFISSEAKSPILVGGKAPKPLDMSYGDYDELRSLLQPYVTRYEARSVKRTADQAAIDGLMSDVRETMASMRTGHPDLERAANRADDFFVHSVKPVRDVTGLIAANPQPSMIAHALLADGAPDRLFHVVRTAPPAMGNQVRTAAWEEGLAQARKPDGTLDPTKLTAWWTNLQPRQQLAIAGGRYKLAVNDLMRTLVDTTNRASELKANRRILDAQIGEVASKLAQADAQLTSAAEGNAKNRLANAIEGGKTIGAALAAPAGLGMGIAHLMHGNYGYALAELGLGGVAARRSLARMLGSDTSLRLLEKMSRATPGTKLAIRLGNQVVASLVHDYLEPHIEAMTSDAPGPQ